MIDFYESVHNCIAETWEETWDWIVEKLSQYRRVSILFNLAILILLLALLLRTRFQ